MSPVRYSPEVRRSLLAKHFLLREADPKTLDQLTAASVVVSYGNRQRIFDKGDDGDRLLGVLRGQVRIYVISSEGRELIMNVIMPGELFGEISLIDGKPRSASAVAIGDTDLLHIKRSDLQTLLQKNSELCFKFMAVLCERVRWTSGLLEDASLLDLPARLAKRLLNLAEGVGEKEGDAIRISVKLSQTDLGNMLGVTREAVNKQLREWKKDGIVDMTDGQVLIQDPKALARLVGR
jgi:CRP/FNR family transcriptional regulator, cyclic AMP receptor protein